jgi:class 3 adenylate cyclase
VDDEMQQGDRGALRIGDAEREATIAALRDAVGDGRVTLDEFADRAGATYAATTVADLRAVVADLGSPDLPAPPPRRVAAPPPPRSQRVVAVMGAAERKGRWTVGSELSAVAVMGGVELDLYDAALTTEVTTIRAFALMGAVEILVPEGVPVQVEGFVLMGALEDRTGSHGGQQPMLRIIGHGLWGAVEVRHRKPRAERAPAPLLEQPVSAGDTFTLLFTDIVGSTVLAERLGDQRWADVLREHNTLVRDQISRHGGDEVKNQGDGFMVAFRSARRALLAAIGIQRALESYRRSHPEHPLHVRIGVHSGEVVADDGDLHGRNVVLASRISDLAGRDEVLASALTKQLADAGGDLCFGAGRHVALKGLSGEWLVHPVEWSAS